MEWVGHKHPVWKHFYFAEEDEDEQKEVAKLLKEVYDGISVKNRKKEGRKTSLEAAFKEPNTQPQEGKID